MEVPIEEEVPVEKTPVQPPCLGWPSHLGRPLAASRTTTSEASGVNGPALQQLLFFALLIGGFYLLAIRPQRARAKALAQVRANLSTGTRVITTAGIHATVVAVEGDEVVLEIAPGVPVRFVSAAVVKVLALDVEPAADDDADDAKGTDR